MTRSILIAFLIAVAAIAWVLSGQIDLGDGKTDSEAAKIEEPKPDLDLPRVRVRWMEAEPRARSHTVRGQIEAKRRAEIRSDSDGRIVELPVEPGDELVAGQVIAKLAEEDLPARLAEAKALLAQRAVELKAARRLKDKGFRAETQLAATNADYQAAEAAVAAVEEALKNKIIVAPFAGTLSERSAEIGDYLQKGDHFATLVELDPALAVGYVNEKLFDQLRPGMSGTIRAANGAEVSGRLHFLSPEAEENTRAYKVEFEFANGDPLIPDGMTADIEIPLREVMAYKVSPALLSLSDEGRIGVKSVDADNRIRFHPVAIAGDDQDGIWITGLPERLRLITVGQEFVSPGQNVLPVDEADSSENLEAGKTAS